jgi:hypothetical protein
MGPCFRRDDLGGVVNITSLTFARFSHVRDPDGREMHIA